MPAGSVLQFDELPGCGFIAPDDVRSRLRSRREIAALLAWTRTLAFDRREPARRWEPKRLRLRILTVAGRIIRSGRRQRLRLPRDWPCTTASTLATPYSTPPRTSNPDPAKNTDSNPQPLRLFVLRNVWICTTGTARAGATPSFVSHGKLAKMTKVQWGLDGSGEI